MIAAKKFCVVKLIDDSVSGASRYKVVPTFWIKNENNITVPYPPEEKLAQNFDRIFDCQLPLAEWEDYHVVIEREADTYQAGILYIKRQSRTQLHEETLLVWKQVSLDYLEQMTGVNPAAIFHSGAEQSQTCRSSTSTFIDIDQGKMTDCGSSSQSGRSPKNKKSAVSKFFNRLSLSKKRENELSHPSTPLLKEQGALEETSTTTAHVNISYAPLTQFATSRDVPPDQSLQAKQQRLLRRLHSTLNEATVIVEEFLLLYKRDN